MHRHLIVVALSAVGATLVSTVAAPAAAETVKVHLRGVEEVPAVSTDASGELRLKINDKRGTIDYELDYENLQGAVTQAHIHVGQKGVAGGISIWLCQTPTNPAPAAVAALTPACPGPNTGSVDGTITAGNVIGPAGQLIAAGQLDEVIAAIRAGVAYGNVHTTAVGSGEIRGQLH
jgi:hypothetical protein